MCAPYLIAKHGCDERDNADYEPISSLSDRTNQDMRVHLGAKAETYLKYVGSLSNDSGRRRSAGR